jgi:hypothetical protein
MMFGTVGVAPGSFTFNSGGQLLGCAEDSDGPYGYGLPSRHRYEAASHWYNCQFASIPQKGCGRAPTPSAAGPDITLDPYGTDSTLQGRSLADAATFMGIRLDVLGVVAAAAVGIGLAVSHFAKKPRRR